MISACNEKCIVLEEVWPHCCTVCIHDLCFPIVAQRHHRDARVEAKLAILDCEVIVLRAASLTLDFSVRSRTAVRTSTVRAQAREHLDGQTRHNKALAEQNGVLNSERWQT